MKIAVPINETGQIDEHFGHCEFYNIFTISDKNEIESVQNIESEPGCGCKSNIAGTLAKHGVTVMIAGGIGQGAINVLNNAGINVIRGCSGDSREVTIQYLSGEISDGGQTCTAHEGHTGHECNH